MQSFPHVEVDGQRRKFPIQRKINLLQIRYHLSDCAADLHEPVLFFLDQFYNSTSLSKTTYCAFYFTLLLWSNTPLVFNDQLAPLFVFICFNYFGIEKNEHKFFKYKRHLGKDTDWTVVCDMRTRAPFV